MESKNCWEVMNCGRQSGVNNILKLKTCPVATPSEFDGTNNGKFTGRLCWTVAGTFCFGKKQGTFADKLMTCLYCDFFEKVKEEEGNNFILIPTINESKPGS